MKFILKIIIFILLTAITQIGGIIYLLSLFISYKWNKNLKFKTLIIFIGIYLFSTLIIVPEIAPFFGREKVTNSEKIKPTNFMTILLNRNYVQPKLNELLNETGKKLSGTNIEIHYLDANFPFINKFPLLPHLSHNDGKKIDISFYKVNDGIASVKWASPPESRVKKLAVFFLTNVIDGSQSISGVRNPVKRTVLMFAKLLGGIVRNFSTVKMKANLVTITKKITVYTGYSYPIESLEIARVNYKGYNIPIPLNSDDCLEMTYGKEWKTPNKNYIWYQEAENLRAFE